MGRSPYPEPEASLRPGGTLGYTPPMHGYDPDPQRGDAAGGCREALVMTRIAYAVLLPPIAVMVGVIAIVFASFYLLTIHPLLALIPLLPVAAAIVWIARRDRRIQREMEDDIRGGPPR